MTHPAELDDAALLAQSDVQRTRRGGPGGQHRNKVETAVVIEHRPTGVRAEASERRSQEENRRVALRRLRIQLALAVRETRPEGDSPSPRWRSRLSGGKISINAEHDDFPPLLAEALDVAAETRWDAPAAAARLGCTTSQLVKLLQKEPAAMTLVNRGRQQLGLKPLK